MEETPSDNSITADESEHDDIEEEFERQKASTCRPMIAPARD